MANTDSPILVLLDAETPADCRSALAYALADASAEECQALCRYAATMIALRSRSGREAMLSAPPEILTILLVSDSVSLIRPLRDFAAEDRKDTIPSPPPPAPVRCDEIAYCKACDRQTQCALVGGHAGACHFVGDEHA